jgi:hypothetical protein
MNRLKASPIILIVFEKKTALLFFLRKIKKMDVNCIKKPNINKEVSLSNKIFISIIAG